MNNFTISNMDKSDLIEVLNINNLCFNPPWSLASLENELFNKFSKYIVAKENDVVIGYAGIWIIIDEAHITNIAVHPDFRELGIGKLLINHIILFCKEHKISSITLEVRKNNLPAINLYKKYGFIENGIRKNYYGNNIDAIIMWKRDII